MRFNQLLFFTLLIILHFYSTEGFTQSYEQDLVIKIDNGEIFIPSNFDHTTKKINFLIHLHGKFSVVQNLVKKSNFNGVLVTLHLGQFSSPYRIAFSDTNFFISIINTVKKILNEKYNIQFDDSNLNIYLTSFSAGYGGIREILKKESFYRKIRSIILLDGLHTDYIFNDGQRKVNPDQMKDFLRFARDATRFKKHFIITHSEINPRDYSSTTETADYLIDSTNSERRLAERLFENDFVQKSYSFNGFFRVFGFYGNQAKDHMKHLYNLDKFLRMIFDE